MSLRGQLENELNTVPVYIYNNNNNNACKNNGQNK